MHLSRELLDSELTEFRRFSELFSELWKNFEDLRNCGFEFGGSFRLEAEGLNSDQLEVSRFRIKAFLVDYRHFHNPNGKNAFFYNVCNLLCDVTNDKIVESMIANQISNWDGQHNSILGWHNDFVVYDFMEVLLNERVFHSGRKGNYTDRLLIELEAKFGESAIWRLAALIVYDRMLCVRNVNWMIGPVLEGRSEVRVKR